MSYTQQAGGGYYSVYVGTVLDMAKILDSFHTAEYQYLPALAMPKGDTLLLKLNNPPSFHKPQSVLVVGLPVPCPDRRLICRSARGGSEEHRCAHKDNRWCCRWWARPMCLPPATRTTSCCGCRTSRARPSTSPATPDPLQGGFVVNAKALEAQSLPPAATGTLHGFWGFEPVEGPSFHLASAHPELWTLASADQHALMVGRKDTVHLDAPADAACVDGVTVKDAAGKTLDATWKAVKPNQIQIEMPLDGEKPAHSPAGKASRIG